VGKSIPFIFAKPKRIYGQDAVQSLMLCLDFVGELLESEMESRDVNVWWVKRGDASGFKDHIGKPKR
jgi:hypothetical protein